MAYYNICPKCGANLDPNELCDCANEEDKNRAFSKFININQKTEQLFFHDKVEINQEGEQ